VTGVAEVRTERLVLRPIEREDLDAFAEMFADPEVVQFIGLGDVATPPSPRSGSRSRSRSNATGSRAGTCGP
jgi:RimJ/RimL family protein N-acetyltransferase